MRSTRLHALTTLTLLATTLSAVAGTKQGPVEVAYRCKDATGLTHFGQSIPSECMGLDVEVLDASGRVVRSIDGAAALDRKVQAEAADRARAQQAELDSQRDRTLLSTYLSIADIERLRDQRLELLQQQSQITRQYIDQLRARESRLMQDVLRFHPYAANEKAPVLPDHVAEDIVNTVNGLQVYEQQLAKNTVEQGRLRESFDRDIGRFRELKGLN